MLTISEQDILFAEQLLLPSGKSFNEERRDFIRCMKSSDVVACPGSGKTTALLAKLLILASKMPFDDHRGICVLTHTNVAINEIKNRAGSIADRLFHYPNFFGTIQQFVNKYLAIPAYRAEFGLPISSIENEVYFSAFSKLYARTKKAKYRLNNLGWDEERVAYLSLSPDDLSVRDALLAIPRLGEKEDSFEEILSIRKSMLQEGVLSYGDAFPLAQRYLTLHPQLRDAFLKRFAFVFVDEAQDTNAAQLAVLNKLFFDQSASVIQYLGDPNQAIFQGTVKKDMHWMPQGDPVLPFSDSHRYGRTISDLLDTVRIDRSISLLPNPKRKSMPPHVLIFEEGEETNVIPAFAQMIDEKNLQAVGSCFKAIGWVGKDKRCDGKLCIPSYFPSYEKILPKKRTRLSNLYSYVYAASTTGGESTVVFHDFLFQGIVHALLIAGRINPENNRPYTVSSFKRHLFDKNNQAGTSLINFISKCAINLKNKTWEVAKVQRLLAKALRNKCSDATGAHWETFLDSNDVDWNEAVEGEQLNTYFYNNDIQVDVATVHSVKGETHTATLYLETSYQKGTDATRLLPFLKGKYPASERKKTYHIENLKMAHVGFSRPTHLLVFACQSSAIMGHEKELKGNGWVIKRVSDF
jgi:DNA helicase II / ATP-dependent DNA helicase PcrA